MKINFTKLWSCSIFMILVFSFCSSANAQVVSVLISKNSDAICVKEQGEGEFYGINLTTIKISGIIDPKSLETKEVKPVNPVWECTYEGATFLPDPKNNPGNPQVSKAEGNQPWSFDVTSSKVGSWKLKFNVKVVYSFLDKNTNEIIPNRTTTLMGTGNFILVVTNKKWTVIINPGNNGIVCRHSKSPISRPLVKVTAYHSSLESKTVIISSTGGGQVFFRKEILGTEDKTDIELEIPKGKAVEFYVSGEKESMEKDDVSIIAKSTGNDIQMVGIARMTVIWVSKITLKGSGKISEENSRRDILYSIGTPPTYDLGLNNYIDRIGWGLEIRGEVQPPDVNTLVCFARESDVYISLETPGEANEISTKNRNDDTSLLTAMDIWPPIIFDFDNPGFLKDDQKIGTIARKRCNYRSYATYGNVRCSDDFQYYMRASVIRMEGKDKFGNFKWEKDNSLPNDNKVESGTIKLER
jgi:hypothetical protein